MRIHEVVVTILRIQLLTAESRKYVCVLSYSFHNSLFSEGVVLAIPHNTISLDIVPFFFAILSCYLSLVAVPVSSSSPL